MLSKVGFGSEQQSFPTHSLMSHSSWRAKQLWAKYATSSMGANWMSWDQFEKALHELMHEIDKGRE